MLCNSCFQNLIKHACNPYLWQKSGIADNAGPKGFDLPAALTLCNGRLLHPIKQACNPYLWQKSGIADNAGPKGRKYCTRLVNPPFR